MEKLGWKDTIGEKLGNLYVKLLIYVSPLIEHWQLAALNVFSRRVPTHKYRIKDLVSFPRLSVFHTLRVGLRWAFHARVP